MEGYFSIASDRVRDMDIHIPVRSSVYRYWRRNLSISSVIYDGGAS